MATILVPTILTNDRNTYLRQYALYSTFSKRVQIDICDGIFSLSQTISLSEAQRDPSWAAMDLHMMVMNPSQYVDLILQIKPSLCIFHAETNENLLPSFQRLKAAGIKTGVAILKQTYPGKIAPYINEVNHCLIFAGTLGQQGGQADMLQIEKVPIIRKIRKDIEIGWDGGANMSNVRQLAHSDIDVINFGAAISGAQDPKKAYQDLSTEADKQGVLI